MCRSISLRTNWNGCKNIHGKTLHSTFKLLVQHGSEPTYGEFSSKTLQDSRRICHSVHTILIDEISRVSSHVLLYIYRRLSAYTMMITLNENKPSRINTCIQFDDIVVLEVYVMLNITMPLLKTKYLKNFITVVNQLLEISLHFFLLGYELFIKFKE